jgi:hypothetical protein
MSTVQANPDANELARKAADEIARSFKCGKDRDHWQQRPRGGADKPLTFP